MVNFKTALLELPMFHQHTGFSGKLPTPGLHF